MLADKRHPLRFILWTLLAVWVTASVAVGGTYLAIRIEDSGEGHYLGRDYNGPERCKSTPARSSLEAIGGFKPLTQGEHALVTRAEGTSTPRTIYVWRGNGPCVRQWSIEGNA